jgi:hypothetical protein
MPKSLLGGQKWSLVIPKGKRVEVRPSLGSKLAHKTDRMVGPTDKELGFVVDGRIDSLD